MQWTGAFLIPDHLLFSAEAVYEGLTYVRVLCPHILTHIHLHVFSENLGGIESSQPFPFLDEPPYPHTRLKYLCTHGHPITGNHLNGHLGLGPLDADVPLF